MERKQRRERRREAPPAAGIQETEEKEKGEKLNPRHWGCHTDRCRGNVKGVDTQSYLILLS